LTRPLRRLRKILLVVLATIIVAVFYCSNLRLIAAGDSFPTALVSLALSTDGSATLDRFAPWTRTEVAWSRGLIVLKEGHFRSVYPIGQAVLAAPLIAPVAAVLNVKDWNIPRQIYFARVAEKGAAAVLTALSVVVLFFALTRLTDRRYAFALAALFALGTSSWPISSQALWQQTGGQLCMAAALYLFVVWVRDPERKYRLVGVGCCCAMAIFIRPTNIVFTAAFGIAAVLAERRWKAGVLIAFPPALVAAALGVYNLVLFGSVFGGYGQYLAPNREPLRALVALLISPGRGLFFFSPFLIFALPALLNRHLWKSDLRPIVTACVLGIAAHLTVVSFWAQWWGGHSWGWRLLTELGPAMVVLVALAVPTIHSSVALKATFVALGAVSVLIQAVGAYCYPRGGWDAVPYPVDAHRVWNWKDNPVSRSIQGGFEWQPYSTVTKLLSRETWTLAEIWDDVPPMDLVSVNWWTFPTAVQKRRVNLESTSGVPTRRSDSCYLDVATIQLAEEGSPLYLRIVGWAFDGNSGTAPEEAVIKVKAPGRETRIVAAERMERPDVAAAFRNPNITRSGIAADILLDQPASAHYALSILQIGSDYAVECTPTVALTTRKWYDKQ
jgi:hypothetical protein